MNERENDNGLFKDKDGFVSIEDWCIYNRISIRRFYSILRKNTDVKFVSNAGVDMALEDALNELKRSQFQQNYEKKKLKAKKLKLVATYKTLGYNLIKDLTANQDLDINKLAVEINEYKPLLEEAIYKKLKGDKPDDKTN